jgi:hypothetical protein
MGHVVAAGRPQMLHMPIIDMAEHKKRFWAK